jgi:2'-5' RNA ligase
MKLKGNTIPGQTISEYFLIISLPIHLRDEILRVREEFHERFTTNYRIKGIPSLALAHFLQYENWEEKIVKRLHQLASPHAPLYIHLNNFGNFPEQAIHIDIDEQSELHELINDINVKAKELLRINRETKPMIISAPHIGIIRKLTPELYAQAWPSYKDQVYQRFFFAEEMILLKRIYGTKRWETCSRLPFNNKPVASLQQGRLF